MTPITRTPNSDNGATLCEQISLLAGEPRTNHPTTVHRVLAATARHINTTADDNTLQHLATFIPHLHNTPTPTNPLDAQKLAIRLALWSLTQITTPIPHQDHHTLAAMIDTTKQWLNDPNETNTIACRNAADTPTYTRQTTSYNSDASIAVAAHICLALATGYAANPTPQNACRAATYAAHNKNHTHLTRLIHTYHQLTTETPQ